MAGLNNQLKLAIKLNKVEEELQIQVKFDASLFSQFLLQNYIRYLSPIHSFLNAQSHLLPIKSLLSPFISFYLVSYPLPPLPQPLP